MNRRESDSADLRRRAEQLLAGQTQTARSEADLRRLMHELEVHQIELQLQNEELRAARLEIEAGLRRYTELFDFAPIGYLVLAPNETIRQLNHAAAELLGGDRPGLVGKPFGSRLTNDELANFRALLAIVCSDEQHVVGELQLKNQVTVRLSAAWLDGPESSILIALEDISEQRRQQQQLLQSERALREADQRKNEFLGMLSHELRNPLAPIRSALFLLGQVEPGCDAAKKAQAVLERQVGHMTAIVDDLLDVTRIARGKIQLKRSHVELCELVARGLEDQRPTFDGISLEGELAPEPLWVDADATRLAQILSNLLGNARKFTPRGGHVTVKLAKEGAQALLVVRDDGEGIAPEMLPRVLEPFQQAPQAMERRYGGLGLGLATVSGLVREHGGTIAIHSDGPGRGTEVKIRLPLSEAPAPVAAVVRPETKRRRVLVIEDSHDAADIFGQLLTQMGHDVTVAYDGPTGIEQARSFHPDVVFCDIGLPEMDGYAVARTMRADRELNRLFLVALSGYARPDDLRNAREAGFDRHMAKPADFDQLEHLLVELPGP
jgi:two-component system CheB/CheR fusion protein